MSGIEARFAAVEAAIGRASAAAGRAAGAVTLIAVSKTIPAEGIAPALTLGHRVFGENYVQESKAKWPGLKARFPDAEIAMIGPLQSNKAREAVALFDAIHSLDRESLAAALVKASAQEGRRPKLFVQVNTGAEPQKAGVLPEAADAFIARCREVHRLDVVGLMCIPPAEGDPAPHFDALAEIARRNGLAGLSMGMSADFETAIRHGATHVRVGSSLFGARPAKA